MDGDLVMDGETESVGDVVGSADTEGEGETDEEKFDGTGDGEGAIRLSFKASTATVPEQAEPSIRTVQAIDESDGSRRPTFTPLPTGVIGTSWFKVV